MSQPLVTIICLCYNHEDFVVTSLESVINQTYPNIQLIVIDDGSSDQSTEQIEAFLVEYPDVEFIKHDINIGNCQSFNEGLVLAKGAYIIDLAADDVLLPERVAKGVAVFEPYDSTYGINFTNAAHIDSSGEIIKHHYAQNEIPIIPEGNVFADVLERYFICPPTTMIRKEVLDQLGGYDESLAYEDFDLWVRASRQWNFCFTGEVLVHKRILTSSHGHQQYKRGNSQMESTYLVCKKALLLCKDTVDYQALRKRIHYEFKHCLWLLKIPLVFRYMSLWLKSIMYR